MTEEEEREKMRKAMDSDAAAIIKELMDRGWTRAQVFDRLPFVFVKLCESLGLQYGFELTKFNIIAKAYRNWLRKKEEVKK